MTVTVETVETTEAARLECCVAVETVETTEAARLECDSRDNRGCDSRDSRDNRGC